MGDIYLRKYGVATTIDFALYKADGTALKTDAVSASGDVTLYRDEAVVETLDDDQFTDEGAIYSLALSAAEMQAARIIVCVVDQTSPQVWLDKTFIVETYGNASAQHAFDLDTATVNLSAATETQIDNIETDTNEMQGKLPTNNIMGSSVKTDKDDEIDAIKAITDTLVLSAIADTIWDEVMDANAPANMNSAREYMNVVSAVLAGKSSGGGTATIVFRDAGDTKNRISATVDADGNRTAVGTQDGT